MVYSGLIVRNRKKNIGRLKTEDWCFELIKDWIKLSPAVTEKEEQKANELVALEEVWKETICIAQYVRREAQKRFDAWEGFKVIGSVHKIRAFRGWKRQLLLIPIKMRRILTNKGLLEFSIAAELNQVKSQYTYW